MRRRWLRLTLLGLGAYLIGLIAAFPAAQAWRLAAARAALPATPYELEGSVWSGRAGALLYRGRNLGALRWRLQPAQLLLGRLALQWNLQQGDGTLDGSAVVTSDGVTLRHLSGRLSAAELMQFNPGLPIAADGALSLNLASVQLPRGGAPVLDGTVVWNRALLVAGQPLQLGDLKLTLKPAAQGGSEGSLTDAGGPLELNGSIALEGGRRYRVDLHLRSRPGADAALANALALLGSADGRGFVRLQYQGVLRPFP